MIRFLTLLAALLIGWNLDPTGGPLEKLAWLLAFAVAFVAFVSLFAPRKVAA